MITIRKSGERGHANHGWLDTYHTFSFAGYYNPNNMGFRSLRVINEDRVAPGRGFGTHPHNDMEIITYVLEGGLEHKDSMGTGSVIRPGDVQKMSAGLGITHSEFNHSDTKPVHLLQIWIFPDTKGIAPKYEQRAYTNEQKRGRLLLVGSNNGEEGAVSIHQDAQLYVTVLEEVDSVTHILANGRHAWVQVARGSITLNGLELKAGDGAAISEEREITLQANGSGEALLFDLA